MAEMARKETEMTKRKQIRITRMGWEELQPLEVADENPEGGDIIEILLAHASIDDHAGAAWDMVLDYDRTEEVQEIATQYDAQYSGGTIGVLPPDDGAIRDWHVYDLIVEGEGGE